VTVVTGTIKKVMSPRYARADAAASVAGDTTDGYTFANTGKQVVVVQQSGSTQRTVTIKNTAGTVVATATLPAAANSQMVLGPFSVQKFGTAPVLVPAHAEVLFSTYDITQFKTAGVTGVVAGGM